MLKILTICIAALVFGALLSVNSSFLPIRPGYIGATLIIVIACWVKHYWRRQEVLEGDEPNAAERNAWLWMTGTALICGFVVAVLFHPGSEVHTTTGDTGGYDSWLILGGVLIAYTLLRDHKLQHDERDRAISSVGTKAGYYALIALLILFLFSLGFAPPHLMQRFTHWLIANILVTLIMLSSLAQYIAQLICYWRDARNLNTYNLRVEP